MTVGSDNDNPHRASTTEIRPENVTNDHLPETGEATVTARYWSANRVRAWIVAGSLALICMGLVGLFVLIVTGVDGERLLVWQAALGSVMPPAAAATAYYFSRSNEDSPTSAR